MKFKKMLIPLSVSLTVLFSASPVLAQSNDGESEFAIEEVVVTATRRATSIQETAISMEAISGSDLEDKGYIGIDQFIDQVPGITAISGGGAFANRIIIRNVATSTQESGSPVIATYFDDFSVSGMFSGSNALRLVDMDRVEVLKGPQGTLFGRSAMGGIVRYISNKAQTDSVEGGFNTYYSNTADGGDNAGGHAFLNQPISDTLAVRFVGYNYSNAGFIDNVELGTKDVNDEDIQGGRIAVHWDATDALSVDFTYLNQSLDAAPNYVSTTRDPGDLNVAGDEGPDVPFDLDARTQLVGIEREWGFDQEIVNLKVGRDFDSFTATFLATQISSEDSNIDDYREFVYVTSGCACDYLEPGHAPNTEDTDIYELRLVSSGDNFIDWIAGVYYEDGKHDASQQNRMLGPDQVLYGFWPVTDGDIAIDSDFGSKGSETAVYGELGFNFTEQTNLTVGYRRSEVEFSNVTTKADGFFLQPPFNNDQEFVGQVFASEEDVSTYKVALSHSYTDDIFVYATAASGYRRGGVNSPTINSPFSTFDSDTVWNYEAGVKSTWMDGALLANVSVYLVDYDDIQLTVQDQVTYSRGTKNVGKAEISGVEFTMAYQFNDYFDMSVAGSFSSPELQEDVPGGDSGKKGDRLPGSAEENFALTANWNQPIRDGLDFYAMATTKYVGARLNDFNLDLDVELPSYNLTDLRIGVRSSEGYTISLFAHNVFDEKVNYKIDRQGPTFESVNTNRPRTMGVNVAYNF